jgi:hypothetical protein
MVGTDLACPTALASKLHPDQLFLKICESDATKWAPFGATSSPSLLKKERAPILRPNPFRAIPFVFIPDARLAFLEILLLAFCCLLAYGWIGLLH